MADSSIEWTNKTWNPVTGCTRVSAGCDHCYAVGMTARLEGMSKSAAGNATVRAAQAKKYAGLTVLNKNGDRHFNGVVRTHEDALPLPLGWRVPQRIFVNSMSDLFHRDVPFAFIDKVFAIAHLAQQHTYQILTKRPERMLEYFASKPAARVMIEARVLARRRGSDMMNHAAVVAWPLPNVWLGTSVENQKVADERIPHLLKTPAAVRFLSMEPLLESVDLGDAMDDETYGADGGDGPCESIHWVIVGGESGPGARPFETAWARSIVEQCRAAGVPCFVKQLGGQPYASDYAGASPLMKLNDRKGGDWNEWPEDLRVREFPQVGVR